MGVEGKNRDKSQRDMILRKIEDKTVSLELVNMAIFFPERMFLVGMNSGRNDSVSGRTPNLRLFIRFQPLMITYIQILELKLELCNIS